MTIDMEEAYVFCLTDDGLTRKCIPPTCVGVNSKYVSKDGNDLSGSSSKASTTSVPPTPRTEGEILQSSNLRSFTFGELKNATRNFRPDSVLGEGGFGSVFKGWIDENSFMATKPGTGLVIAVKRLNQEGLQGHREWLVSSTCLFWDFAVILVWTEHFSMYGHQPAIIFCSTISLVLSYRVCLFNLF